MRNLTPHLGLARHTSTGDIVAVYTDPRTVHPLVHVAVCLIDDVKDDGPGRTYLVIAGDLSDFKPAPALTSHGETGDRQ